MTHPIKLLLSTSGHLSESLSKLRKVLHALEECHKQVQEAIQEMEHARAANHYDMAGHGAKAEGHLRAAEQELSLGSMLQRSELT
jgi:hypothetical protein